METVSLYLAQITDSMGITVWANWFGTVEGAAQQGSAQMETWDAYYGNALYKSMVLTIRPYATTRK